MTRRTGDTYPNQARCRCTARSTVCLPKRSAQPRKRRLQPKPRSEFGAYGLSSPKKAVLNGPPVTGRLRRIFAVRRLLRVVPAHGTDHPETPTVTITVITASAWRQITRGGCAVPRDAEPRR